MSANFTAAVNTTGNCSDRAECCLIRSWLKRTLRSVHFRRRFGTDHVAAWKVRALRRTCAPPASEVGVLAVCVCVFAPVVARP